MNHEQKPTGSQTTDVSLVGINSLHYSRTLSSGQSYLEQELRWGQPTLQH